MRHLRLLIASVSTSFALHSSICPIQTNICCVISVCNAVLRVFMQKQIREMNKIHATVSNIFLRETVGKYLYIASINSFSSNLQYTVISKVMLYQCYQTAVTAEFSQRVVTAVCQSSKSRQGKISIRYNSSTLENHQNQHHPHTCHARYSKQSSSIAFSFTKAYLVPLEACRNTFTQTHNLNL